MPGPENIWCRYRCHHHCLHLLSTLGTGGVLPLPGHLPILRGLAPLPRALGAEACVYSNPPASSKHSPFLREGAASPTAF